MLVTILITAIAVSLDGLIAGFAYGVDKIRVPTRSLFIISAIPIFLCFISMCFATAISQYISDEFIKIFGFLAMLILAMFSIRQYFLARKDKLEMKTVNLSKILAKPSLADLDNMKDIDLKESVIVGLAIGLDAIFGCIALAFLGANIFITPVIIGIAHFVFMGSGNFLGKSIKIKADFLRLISATIFICLGVIRLVG